MYSSSVDQLPLLDKTKQIVVGFPIVTNSYPFTGSTQPVQVGPPCDDSSDNDDGAGATGAGERVG